MSWLLPHSTLMLVLMILFAALFSYSYLNSVEYESALVDLEMTKSELSPSKREIHLAKSIRKFIEDMGMEGVASVNVTPHAIKLKLSSPVMFESGSAELTPFIMPMLVELLRHLKDMENTIIVEGHTDNVPIHSALYRSNWELSAARAFSIIYFYIKRDIKPERLIAHGYGEHRPFYSNESEFGRAMNRRIEITIVRGG